MGLASALGAGLLLRGGAAAARGLGAAGGGRGARAGPTGWPRAWASGGGGGGGGGATGERLRESRRRRLAAEGARGRARRGARAGGRASAPAPAPGAPGSEARGSVAPAGGGLASSSLVQALAHRCLVVTREVEWGGVFLGYEQQNRYTLRNEAGEVVGYMAEEGEGFSSMLARQILRTHRPFSAVVLDTRGLPLFRVRRPFYFISSAIFVEEPAEGHVQAEVRQRWHPFMRNYDLYLGRKQFAQISAGFLSWEFELKSEAGGTLALVDRNFSGLGVELFTDAGKYVVHFGESAPGEPRGRPPPQRFVPWGGGIGGAGVSIGGLTKMRTDVLTDRDAGGHEVLQVERSLRLGERAAVLAAAISIDFDYFSRHSRGGSSFPFFLPFFGGGGGGEDASDGGGWGGWPSD